MKERQQRDLHLVVPTFLWTLGRQAWFQPASQPATQAVVAEAAVAVATAAAAAAAAAAVVAVAVAQPALQGITAHGRQAPEGGRPEHPRPTAQCHGRQAAAPRTHCASWETSSTRSLKLSV